MARTPAVVLLVLSLTGCFVATDECLHSDLDCLDAGVPVDRSPPASNGGAGTYDFVKDFSASRNPSGPWGYGSRDTLGVFARLTATTTTTCGTMPIWTGAGEANIWRNTTGGTCFGGAPGQVSLHPGASGQFAVVRFTAPAPGEWDFEAQFFSGDLGETDVTITKNGTSLDRLATSSGSPTFGRTIALLTGDTVDFELGARGDWSYDNTPTSIRVTRR